MTPTFRELPELKVIGFPTVIHMATVQQQIPPLWNFMSARAKEIANLTSTPQCIGLEYYPWDFKEAQSFVYMPAYVVQNFDSIHESLCAKILPAGLYAVFTHKGSIATIQATFDFIYQEWLPNNGKYTAREDYDMEWYDNRFMGMDVNSELDILLPVKENS